MHRGLEKAVQRVRGEHEHALVISHGSALRMFLESLSGQPERPMENMQYREVLHDGSRFSLV
jgi:broad specificity phosphatase PhoE